MVLPEVASSAFRQAALELIALYFPGADTVHHEKGMARGNLVLVQGLDPDIAAALAARFARIPIKARVEQGADRVGTRAMLSPLALTVGVAVGAGAYVAFPGLIALDLLGGGLAGLTAGAVLALRRRKPVADDHLLPAPDESAIVYADDFAAARAVHKDLPEAARVPFATAIAASAAASLRLAQDDLVAASAQALDDSLDDLRDEALAIARKLAAGREKDEYFQALRDLAALAEQIEAEIERTEKTLAGEDLRQQIEDKLGVVRDTTAILADA